MTTTFETAKVGDRVWSIERGWGVIQSLDSGEKYPIIVEFQNERSLSYTLGGKRLTTYEIQTLFWDEVVIDAPAKPLPVLQVDTKVLVWNNSKEHAQNAHFCCFEDGKIYTYGNGRTSFTKLFGDYLNGWNYWELAE